MNSSSPTALRGRLAFRARPGGIGPRGHELRARCAVIRQVCKTWTKRGHSALPVLFPIVDEAAGKPRTLAFIMPEDAKGDEPPARFLTSIRVLEGKAGLDFFKELPKAEQDKLETAAQAEMW